MNRWRHVLREGFITGSAASLLSTVALLVFGRAENRSAYASLNAISHWLWDRKALSKDAPPARYTAVGYGIHHLASVFWAAVYTAVYGRRECAKQPLNALLGGAGMAAVACFVDYRMTPERLTPGFEHRLSKPALAGVYLAFGLGLALASVALADKRK